MVQKVLMKSLLKFTGDQAGLAESCGLETNDYSIPRPGLLPDNPGRPRLSNSKNWKHSVFWIFIAMFHFKTAQRWIYLKFKAINLNQVRGPSLRAHQKPCPPIRSVWSDRPCAPVPDWVGRFSNKDIESWSMVIDPQIRSLRLSSDNEIISTDFDSYFMTFEDWQKSFSVFV